MKDACRRRRCVGAALVLGAWFLVAPPETVTYWTCKRVRHDDVPVAEWKPALSQHGFESEEACAGFRAELVRRESNPRRIANSKEYRERINREYDASTPLLWKVVGRLFIGCPGTDADWFPLDYYSHTRCAYIEHDEQYPMKEPAE